MVRVVVLCVGAIAILSWAPISTGQIGVFLEPLSPLFVFIGGVLLALGVTKDGDNLSVQRLEAFRYGCTLFGVIGTLSGLIAIGAGVENPAAIGPSLAIASLTLLWAAVFNYVAKLVIISKSSDG